MTNWKKALRDSQRMSRNTLTEAQVMERFEAAYRKAGSYRALAKAWGFSAPYLYDVHKGRRPFAPDVLKHMGLTVEVVVTTKRIYRVVR